MELTITNTGLRAGLTHTGRLLVDESLTVPRVSGSLAAFADMPPVFATAYLVAFVEATCIEAVAPLLSPGHKTVGTHVDLSHTAATPVGMTVVAASELVGVEGRRLRFAVECRDEVDMISSGLQSSSPCPRNCPPSRGSRRPCPGHSDPNPKW
jgi:fluoroacetyl-CoA thioesterase